MKRERLSDGEASEPVVRLMLDSGAYTAWVKGIEIDIDAYIDFIKQHKKYLHTYVNLDVIPGKPNQKRSQADIEESAKRSYANLQYMKKHGLRPIPVFHQGERFYWLERMMAEGEDYIGISPMADLSTAVILPWMDRTFTITTDKAGVPLIRTHGFGVTSIPLMFRYPWTSCDSTSWALMAGLGRILVPRFSGPNPDYTKQPIIVGISDMKKKPDSKPGKDSFESLGPLLQGRIARFANDALDLTLTDLRYDYSARQKVNMFTFMRVCEARGPDVRFKHRRHDLMVNDDRIEEGKGRLI